VDIDPKLAFAGLLVGLLVGATGMGGGAILTPLLVLGFGVPPLAAVSSDLLTSLVIKPVAAVVHLRKRTVNLGLVTWLAVGAVPAGVPTCYARHHYIRSPVDDVPALKSLRWTAHGQRVLDVVPTGGDHDAGVGGAGGAQVVGQG